ncbi:LOG family protein [Coraliomargarita sp. SDUM461004]|uniref:AMP nucleosidase n=1 Tax=Thalassobacterium sedimentorum TaxID=3041258 RepID=A0ABU1AJF6_9BACT|nr:LOG family protein [Coraliomargarita sp. SDUM461004]MDQ8194949.1 LOG family protein [Coraliomargarita sp. SDUM461004]
MTLPPERSRDDWPQKAYNNRDFLNSDPARSIRVLCEMTEPGLRFAKEKVEDTIVLFGSARIKPLEIAEEQLATVQARIKNPDKLTIEEARSLHQATCSVQSAPYYEAAVKLSESLTQWSLNLPGEHQDRFLICSGGGPGIMEAANLGAHNVGGKSIGLGISLPFEQGVNPYIPEELKFEFHYFFVRKYWFVLLAKALVAFPGGFGTMDELFETLTLVQTKKIEKLPPIVLFGSEFWNDVVNFDALVKWGTISPEDVDLFKIVDTVEEAHDYIVNCLTERFLT